ncbi:MAG: hypothetical protein Q8P50_02425 [Bacillota bacterium]|nr:hypothetical protein [Bacillota bacterium]
MLMDMGKGILKGIAAAVGVTDAAEVGEHLAKYADRRAEEKGSTFRAEVAKKAGRLCEPID